MVIVFEVRRQIRLRSENEVKVVCRNELMVSVVML